MYMVTAEAEIELFTDGAARGNPGPAAWAYIAVRNGALLRTRSGYLGTATNNVAEYHAVLNALRDTLSTGVDTVSVISDSELVVRQLRGEYRVKAEHLADLFRQVKRLEAEYKSVTYIPVPRNHPRIAEVDRLCNLLLDEYQGRGGMR
ncbi:MAG: ribonuclease HI family protein [Methanoculleaceae archaeon]